MRCYERGMGLFRAVGVEIDAVRKELTERSAKSLLQDGGLVLDTFDNSASRRLVQEQARAATALPSRTVLIL